MIESDNLTVIGLLVAPRPNVKTELARREAAMAALQQGTHVILETEQGRITYNPAAMLATGEVEYSNLQTRPAKSAALRYDEEDDELISVQKGGVR